MIEYEKHIYRSRKLNLNCYLSRNRSYTKTTSIPSWIITTFVVTFLYRVEYVPNALPTAAYLHALSWIYEGIFAQQYYKLQKYTLQYDLHDVF
jgi:hypothetical protein